MSGVFGQVVSKRGLDYLLGLSNAWAGSTLTPYLFLSSTLPTAVAGNITEPNTGTNYGGYTRQPFVNTSAASAGAVANTSGVTFPTPATYGGFDAKYYGIYLSSSSGSDAPSSTNLVCAGTLTQELICNIGVPVTASVGAFTMSISTVISGITVAGANALLDVLSGRIAANTNYPAAMYFSLYTTLPTNAQAANTNEAAYTSYARLSAAGLITAATTATPSAAVLGSQATFAAATGGSATIVGWGAGPSSSGATALYVAGATASQAIGVGNQPNIPAATTLATLQ